MNERFDLLGPIFNFVQQPGPTPLDAAHQAGLTFVAMDARAYPDFSGARLTGEWVVAREVQTDPRTFEPWPKTGWRFQDEGAARQAYQAMRNHAYSRLPGVQLRDDRGPERELNDPATAWGEAFVVNGEEVLYLSCDKATEARILKMMTDRLEPYQTRGQTPARYAAYNSQTALHHVAVHAGPQGAEHVLVAFAPEEEQGSAYRQGPTPHIQNGLAGSTREDDLKPFTLDVPSGILVIAWGRIDGAGYFAQARGQDPAGVIHQLIGNRIAAPLPTPLDGIAPGPLAWGVHVKPGTYHCVLRFLETTEGISAMALSHTEALPVWHDMPGAQPKPYGMQQAQAAQQQIASGGGGDPDPVVFPGQPLARLSDYVKLMKGMQSGDMQGALARAGLDMMSYGRVAQAWGMKLAADPVLTAKFSAMMAAR